MAHRRGGAGLSALRRGAQLGSFSNPVQVELQDASRHKWYVAPYRGWNTYDPFGDMPSGYFFAGANIYPDVGSVKVRRGSVKRKQVNYETGDVETTPASELFSDGLDDGGVLDPIDLTAIAPTRIPAGTDNLFIKTLVVGPGGPLTAILLTPDIGADVYISRTIGSPNEGKAVNMRTGRLYNFTCNAGDNLNINFHAPGNDSAGWLTSFSGPFVIALYGGTLTTDEEVAATPPLLYVRAQGSADSAANLAPATYATWATEELAGRPVLAPAQVWGLIEHNTRLRRDLIIASNDGATAHLRAIRASSLVDGNLDPIIEHEADWGTRVLDHIPVHAYQTNSSGDGFTVIAGGPGAPVVYDGVDGDDGFRFSPLLARFDPENPSDDDPVPAAAEGASLDSLAGVVAFKRRLWYWERGRRMLWYSEPFTVGGRLRPFPLGAVSEGSGVIVSAAPLSRDGGDGPDDYLCVMFADGHAVMYSGIDPAEDIVQIGHYGLGTPLGNNALFQFRSGIVAITETGILDVGQAIQDQGIESGAELTKIIRPSVARAAQLGRVYKHWQGFIHPQGHMVLFNIPTGPANAEQYVLNAERNSFTRFTGWNALCFGGQGDRLIYGRYDGSIVEADIGSTDEGEPYGEMFCQQAFMNLYNPGLKKRVQRIVPAVAGVGHVCLLWGIAYGWNPRVLNHQRLIFDLPSGVEWVNEGIVWQDGGIDWGEIGGVISNTELTMGGIGRSASISVSLDVEDPSFTSLEWYGTTVFYKVGTR